MRRNRICVICFRSARSTQDEIDKMPCPPPVNPETRGLEEIAFLRDWLASHPRANTRMKIHITRQIMRLEKMVREYLPTKYLPSARLKGGKA